MQTGLIFINLYLCLIYFFSCMMTLSSAIVSVSSLYVLCALLHSGPGEGGNRSQLDQSKRIAFCNMACIVGVLLVRFVAQFVIAILDFWLQRKCILLMCVFLFSLPTSLPLPMLFIHRVGKLCCCINGCRLCNYMTSQR